VWTRRIVVRRRPLHHRALRRATRLPVYRSACWTFFCFFFKRHNRNIALLLRATRLLRLHGIFVGSATAASVAAFGCHNGLNCDYRACLDGDMLTACIPTATSAVPLLLHSAS
jgi:hypothetical protein